MSEYLTVLSTGLVVSAMITFARIGTVIIMVPGFGDARIPARIRIITAVMVTLALTPAVPQLTMTDASVSTLAMLIAFEATIGVYFGVATRLFLVTVHILGAKIGYTAGLANALSPNDGNFESASSLSSLLYMGALTFIFATNTHHLILTGIISSYSAIPIGTLPISDFAQQLARISADTFYIAAYIGAPFLVFSVLFNAALGLSNRVMPAMHVFFVASPAMIILGLSLLALTAPMVITTLNTELANWLQDLVR
jgi:flagellar biosynthesis protein FliR